MTTAKRDEAGIGISLPALVLVIHEGEEGGTGYWGEVLGMSGCLSQGETIEEVQENLLEALEALQQHAATTIPDAPSYSDIWLTTSSGTA